MTDISTKLRGIRLNRKATTFLLCFLIAFLFWLLSALSKDYSTTITIPVKYTNLPGAKVVSNELPSAINGIIRAKGYKLIRYSLMSFTDTLQFDVSSFMFNSNDSLSVIVTSRVVEALSKQLKGNVKLLEINPDTLFFNFSKKISKKVPVKINVSLDFAEQYRLTGKIIFSPESVLVSGDAAGVSKIKFVETEALVLTGVKKNSVTYIPVKADSLINKRVKISESKIKVMLNVAKFTERTMELPIIIRNTPKGISLRLFPDKAAVKFLLPLDSYEKTREDMFLIEVDASGVLTNKEPMLKVVLVKQPDWVDNVSVSPLKVEYIIKK